MTVGHDHRLVVPPEVAKTTSESWFILHHLVRHNNKDRIVFNYSIQYEGKSLNQLLLPGPALGPSLLGDLIWFRQYPVEWWAGTSKGCFTRYIFYQLTDQFCASSGRTWRGLKSRRSMTVKFWHLALPAVLAVPSMFYSDMFKTYVSPTKTLKTV